jgi:hypothetical protein
MRFMVYALIIPFAVFGAVRWFLVRADKGFPETSDTEWNV